MTVRYIRVKTDTTALTAVATRSYGNLAILGRILPKVGTTTVVVNPASQIVILTPSVGQTFPTGVTFTLSYGGQTTTGIAPDASASDVKAALVALSTIGADNVQVMGSRGGPYTVTLQGTAANNPTSLSATNPALVGTATVTGTVGNQTVTLNPPTGQQQFPDNSKFTLSYGGQTTPGISTNATAADVKAALAALSSIGGAANVNVTSVNARGGPYLVVPQGTAAAHPTALSATNPTGPDTGVTAVVGNPGSQIVALTSNTTAAFQPNTTFTLSYTGQTTAPIAVNASFTDVQNALKALSTVGSDANGTANVTVAGNNGGPYTVTFQGKLASNASRLIATDPIGPPAPANDTSANFVQVNVPEPFSDPERAAQRCAGPLGDAIQLAFEQSPGPALIYAIRTADSPDWTGSLETIKTLNVQLVVLANQPLTTGSNGSVTTNNALILLAKHVHDVSTSGGDGMERIGVAMLAKSSTTTATVVKNSDLKSDRMFYVAHKSDQDAAAAVAGAIAGYEPSISLLLKPVKITTDLFSPSEIDTINTDPDGNVETDNDPPRGAGVNWLTQTPLLPGGGIYLGEGYTGDASGGVKWIDIRRTLDDITFRLKAQLITAIGNLRITRADLRTMVGLLESVLIPLMNNNVIDNYKIDIRLLTLLDKDPLTLSGPEKGEIKAARDNRQVKTIVVIVYAGAIHRLNLTLKLTSV